MFKSKKFFSALFICAVVGALVPAVYITQKNKLPDIFSYIPSGMDQVMVNRAEKNMQSNANSLVEIPQAVQQQFQQIKVMIIVQNHSFSGQQMLFLETREKFSPQDFLKTINPETETIYTYIRLNDGQYLFGPQQILKSYAKPTLEKSLFNQQQLIQFIPTIKQSSLSMISYNNDVLSSQKQYTSLLDSAEYLLMNLSSNKGKFEFSSYILFSKAQTGFQSSFKPQFQSYLKESTIAYLEVGKLLSGMNISNQMFSGTAQDMLIKKLLAHNLGIVVSKGSNMTNIGLTVIADDASLFSDLEPLFPLLGVWLQSQPWLTGSQVTTVQQPGKIGYDIIMQGNQKIGVYLEQSDNQTKLSLGNPLIEGKKKKISSYSKNALAVIYVDMNQLLGIYKQFLNIGINASVLTTAQESMLAQMEDKVLRGEISIDQDKISIEGSIK